MRRRNVPLPQDSKSLHHYSPFHYNKEQVQQRPRRQHPGLFKTSEHGYAHFQQRALKAFQSAMSLVPYTSREGREIVLYVIPLPLSPAERAPLYRTQQAPSISFRFPLPVSKCLASGGRTRFL